MTVGLAPGPYVHKCRRSGIRQSAGLTVSPGSGLPSSFFSVHRLVRTLQQRVGIVAILGVAGEADARPNAQDRSFPDNGLGNGCANLVHQSAGTP